MHRSEGAAARENTARALSVAVQQQSLVKCFWLRLMRLCAPPLLTPQGGQIGQRKERIARSGFDSTDWFVPFSCSAPAWPRAPPRSWSFRLFWRMTLVFFTDVFLRVSHPALSSCTVMTVCHASLVQPHPSFLFKTLPSPFEHAIPYGTRPVSAVSCW